MKHHKRAQIELSINFIVVIVISIVIIAGGIVIFFKLKNQTKNYVDSVDQQTESELRAQMLSNNYKVSVYPTDITLKRGDSALIGLGINNDFDRDVKFSLQGINPVQEFATPNSIPANFNWPNADFIAGSGVPPYHFSTVKAKSFFSKNIMIQVPNTASAGKMYAIKVTINCDSPANPPALAGCLNTKYGVAKIYVTVS